MLPRTASIQPKTVKDGYVRSIDCIKNCGIVKMAFLTSPPRLTPLLMQYIYAQFVKTSSNETVEKQMKL